MRISGVPVGKVKTIEANPRPAAPTSSSRSSRKYAPLPEERRGDQLRQKTLLGETYVELTPGDKSGGYIPEAAQLPEGGIEPTVELDEIFRSFDKRTRDSSSTGMQQLAIAGAGRGARHRRGASRNSRRSSSEAAKLLEDPQQQDAERSAGSSATPASTSRALSERQGQLRGLIRNSNRVFETTAARNEELARDVRRAADVRASSRA